MVLALAILLFFSPIPTFSQNVKNNACSKIDSYLIAAISPNCRYNPDVLSDVIQMTERHGYTSETLTVTTDDGYILTIFKISSRDNPATKLPVFVQHGIAINSGSWTDISNRSLAFRLVDEGHDVYLGNLRGSIYSNKHESLSINNPKYWNFNLDTIAEKDIPTMLNFVAKLTNSKLLYVGHSMGTTLSFMFSSEFSEEASNLLQGIVALAPVAYLNNVPLIDVIKPITLPLIDILSVLQIKGLFYQEKIIHTLETIICKNFIPELCFALMRTIPGETTKFAPDDMLVFLSYWPSGLSIYQLKQYLQIANSNKFEKYNFGILNIKNYGKNKPPTYDLNKISVPVCLLYGENDILFNKNNLERLYDEIGSTDKCKYSISAENGEGYSHLDFLYAENIEEELYERLFEVLNLQSGNDTK